MLKIDDNVKGLDMTFTLDARQTAIIASAVKQEWFEIIQRMMEQEVKALNVRLINTMSGNTSEVLANHAIAKGAGMFYIGFIQRIEQILQEANYKSQGIGTVDNPEQPPYQAEFEPAPTGLMDEVG